MVGVVAVRDLLEEAFGGRRGAVVVAAVVDGEVPGRTRGVGQPQLFQFVHTASGREDPALFAEKLGHQVLYLAPLELQQGVDKVAVDEDLEGDLEPMVDFVEAQGFAYVLVAVATHLWR